MDVKTAFLYGTLKEEIYMRLPEGYRTQGKVARLYKCIYGLKQSAREWYECLSTLLQQIGFLSSEFDPCVFVHTANSAFVSTYVGGLGIFGPNPPFIKEAKDKLSTSSNARPWRCSLHPWTRNHLLPYRHRYLPNGVFTQSPNTLWYVCISTCSHTARSEPATTESGTRHRNRGYQ